MKPRIIRGRTKVPKPLPALNEEELLEVAARVKQEREFLRFMKANSGGPCGRTHDLINARVSSPYVNEPVRGPGATVQIVAEGTVTGRWSSRMENPCAEISLLTPPGHLLSWPRPISDIVAENVVIQQQDADADASLAAAIASVNDRMYRGAGAGVDFSDIRPRSESFSEAADRLSNAMARVSPAFANFSEMLLNSIMPLMRLNDLSGSTRLRIIPTANPSPSSPKRLRRDQTCHGCRLNRGLDPRTKEVTCGNRANQRVVNMRCKAYRK